MRHYKSRTVTLTAPSYWASYLINGDASGLSHTERRDADRWLARVNMGWPFDCEDAGFRWQHDAFAECPTGAECQFYVFHTVQHTVQHEA